MTVADTSAGAVLRAVLEQGTAPRSAIARQAGLSPATVTAQVRALVAAGLLVELPETAGPAGMGRPHSPLVLDLAGNAVIGVHIAAEHCTVAVLDIAGAVRLSRRVPHASLDPEVILAEAAAQVCRVRDELTERVLGLGVAIGGWVDSSAGSVIDHTTLRWRNVPVRRHFSEATGLPVTLDGHTRALVHAEQLFGHARDTAATVVLFAGNVIDVAFAVHGRVHYGPRSAAGAITRLVGGETAESALAACADRVLVARAQRAGLPVRGIAELINLAVGNASARALFVARAEVLGRVLAVVIDLLDPDTAVIVDPALVRVPGVRAAYLEMVRRYSACERPEEIVTGSSFFGRVLETAAGAAVLHRLYTRPLSVIAEIPGPVSAATRAGL
ncbi:ROK family transcriptional regulator [Nocardia yamanashiensis]|uniref:ROK family transcriptional regulator n=1 Tax=Nocardia yamanashiensis TaxID=209247 RepID=UPI001E2AB49E|nr:ROK family transcriptional regulator [Nocardia yamanashiensis]UGT43128.1 ROK family transcriptional regulator [Nocardia yamanashiensis]